jgi:hypothetical protein
VRTAWWHEQQDEVVDSFLVEPQNQGRARRMLERPAADQSRSQPPTLGDADKSTMEITRGDVAPLIKDANVLQLEKVGALS